MSEASQDLPPEIRASLIDLRRQLGREIGQKRAQISSINKLLGEPQKDVETSVRTSCGQLGINT